MVTTDRNIVKYIIFNLITCGLYNIIFLHYLAQDMNTVAAGDGKQTPGIFKFFLLTLVTCGIYSFIWYYNLGNRMVDAGQKYGLNIRENGTTILLWILFGSLLFGIGPIIAMYFIIRNMNDLCTAYNNNNQIVTRE